MRVFYPLMPEQAPVGIEIMPVFSDEEPDTFRKALIIFMELCHVLKCSDADGLPVGTLYKLRGYRDEDETAAAFPIDHPIWASKFVVLYLLIAALHTLLHAAPCRARKF